MHIVKTDKYLAKCQAVYCSFASVVSQGENCTAKIHEFCKNVLKIQNPESTIRVERAHRIGRRAIGKSRPIVVKFGGSRDKEFIKQAARAVDLKASNFRVVDQFPQEVLDKRKELIPKMLEERSKGKDAVLVRDKLYVNKQLVE